MNKLTKGLRLIKNLQRVQVILVYKQKPLKLNIILKRGPIKNSYNRLLIVTVIKWILNPVNPHPIRERRGSTITTNYL